MSDTVEKAIEAMGLSLPAAAAPAGSYVPVVRTGNLLFVAGQIPMGPNGVEHVGRCGEDLDTESAQAAARLCALNILAQVKGEIGDFDNLVRIVKVNGYVNSTPAFRDHPKVINGASDLLVEVLGERGRHARAAVGVANLPFGVAVEVEAVVEVKP
jgi:enamine deaminase RidA (YjgF/YER057c/UK114 family)